MDGIDGNDWKRSEGCDVVTEGSGRIWQRVPTINSYEEGEEEEEDQFEVLTKSLTMVLHAKKLKLVVNHASMC